MGMGSGGRGGGMPAYQQMSSYPQGPSGKGGASPYGPPPQRMSQPSPYGGGKGGSRQMPYNTYPGQFQPPPQNTYPGPNTNQPAMSQAEYAAAEQMRMNPAETMNQRRIEPPNPFEGNTEYQALMDYQKTLSPTEEQQKRLQELQSAFEGTGAYKDYRIQQLENQQREMQRMAQMAMQRRNPYAMGGIGAFRGQFGPPVQREFGGFAPIQREYMPPPQPEPMPEFASQYMRQMGGFAGSFFKKGGQVSR